MSLRSETGKLIALWVPACGDTVRRSSRNVASRFVAPTGLSSPTACARRSLPSISPWAVTGADAAAVRRTPNAPRGRRSMRRSTVTTTPISLESVGSAAGHPWGEPAGDRTARSARLSRGARWVSARRAGSPSKRGASIPRHRAGLRSCGASSAEGVWRSSRNRTVTVTTGGQTVTPLPHSQEPNARRFQPPRGWVSHLHFTVSALSSCLGFRGLPEFQAFRFGSKAL